MRALSLIIPLVLVLSQHAFSVEFDQYFKDNTLRIDYFHSGTQDDEKISIDQLYQVSPWAGTKHNLIDTLNSGHYLIRVIDTKSNQLIYSYGFSTLFNEWQTTDEATQGGWKTIHETILIPYPKHKIQIEFWGRDKQNYFGRLIFNTRINPESYSIIKENRASDVEVLDSSKNGNPAQKVDLAIIGEGFTSNEANAFLNTAKGFVDTMFTIAPFSEHRDEFNIYYVLKPSPDSGTDDPRKGLFNNTSINTSFNTFDSQRYLMTYDSKSVHDIASAVPYDAIIIVINSATYGGGGIYNLYASTSAFNEWSDYVFVHEFGHSFAGLGDEYYTSDVAYSEFYPPGTEPWEANITPLLNPKHVKWSEYVAPDMPLPTPWDKEKFDQKSVKYRKGLKLLRDQNASELEIEKYQKKYQKWVDDFFANHPYRDKVGAFEGAGYASSGLYRPALNCIMFSKGLPGFDPVCKNAIERRIRFLAE